MRRVLIELSMSLDGFVADGIEASLARAREASNGAGVTHLVDGLERRPPSL